MPGRLFSSVFACALAALSIPTVHAAQTQACKPVYLTLDTGSMRDADAIADLLEQRQIVATFFLASEKTVRGDYSLDATWAPYWQRLEKAGHAFGTHTLRHGKIFPSKGTHAVSYRPQFGEQAGQVLQLSNTQFCDELNAVAQRFKQMTGADIGPVWRAPGGKFSPEALKAARSCGYQHVGWSDAGFLGDELDSSKFSNALLQARALNNIRSGDILVAHLGIWSRKEHFFPALKNILTGLQNQGFCFKTLREHPTFKDAYKP